MKVGQKVMPRIFVRAKEATLCYSHTTMTIKLVEFFIYIKILHIIVKINTATLEVVALEFNTLGPVSLPLLEAILEFFNRQCL